eukprot:CAMPEP_0179313830 /NCGR_PEP_ID=MMETSP0797-20121207/54047_1 /TAXON_ID=47934 /ORGANISM="Dinophysis acuminata, Strain DAEP01" /LENGTH=349 /DNA_ID=CAMNT_0021023933 /DNA_START=207 /DNA_END=1253 /DNA_ORIENTATION=-
MLTVPVGDRAIGLLANPVADPEREQLRDARAVPVLPLRVRRHPHRRPRQVCDIPEREVLVEHGPVLVGDVLVAGELQRVDELGPGLVVPLRPARDVGEHARHHGEVHPRQVCPPGEGHVLAEVVQVPALGQRAAARVRPRHEGLRALHDVPQGAERVRVLRRYPDGVPLPRPFLGLDPLVEDVPLAVLPAALGLVVQQELRVSYDAVVGRVRRVHQVRDAEKLLPGTDVLGMPQVVVAAGQLGDDRRPRAGRDRPVEEGQPRLEEAEVLLVREHDHHRHRSPRCGAVPVLLEEPGNIRELRRVHSDAQTHLRGPARCAWPDHMDGPDATEAAAQKAHRQRQRRPGVRAH